MKKSDENMVFEVLKNKNGQPRMFFIKGNKAHVRRVKHNSFSVQWKKDNKQYAVWLTKEYCDNKGSKQQKQNKDKAKLEFFSSLPDDLKKCICGGVLSITEAVVGQRCEYCINHEKAKKIIFKFSRKIRKHYDNTSMRIALRQIRAGARVRGIPFSITEEDLDMPEFCPILGVKILYDRSKRLAKRSKGTHNHAPSVDRINSSLGYVKGNVAIVSMKANRIKNEGTIDEHQKVIDYMKKHSMVKYE